MPASVRGDQIGDRERPSDRIAGPIHASARGVADRRQGAGQESQEALAVLSGIRRDAPGGEARSSRSPQDAAGRHGKLLSAEELPYATDTGPSRAGPP